MTSIRGSLTTLLALGLALAGAAHAAAEPADPRRGQALYENHCQFCHTPKIHSRPGKLPLARAELRAIVEHWRKQQGLTWSGEDVEDVVEYLQQTRYRSPGTGE